MKMLATTVLTFIGLLFMFLLVCAEVEGIAKTPPDGLAAHFWSGLAALLIAALCFAGVSEINRK
jgi:hypothetical protein